MTDTDPKVATDEAAPRRRRRVKRKVGVEPSRGPTKMEAQPAAAPNPPSPAAEAITERADAPQRRRVRVKHKLGVAPGGSPAKTESRQPEVADDGAEPHRRRVRVRRRVTPLFHLSRKHQQLLAALVIAIVAAVVVANFVSASMDNPASYVPGGAVH